MNWIKHKYFIAFVSAILVEFWFNMCAYAANHNSYPVAIFSNLTYPFVSMVPILLIVEEKTIKEKLKLAMFEGFGYTFGTVIFLAFIKHRLDSFTV